MSPRRHDEVKVHGRHACRALFQQRPDDVLRVYLTEELVRPFGDLLRYCAKRRRPYKIVPPEELLAVTESRHHEGLCVVARARAARDLEAVLRAPGPGVLVALGGVSNPHNVGAIVRTAAHFGAAAVLTEGEHEGLSPAVLRTSEGGAEWVDVVRASPLSSALARCREAGFVVCATAGGEGRELWSEPLPERAVVLLGAEGEGLPRPLLGAADVVLTIPGTGHVESLNVSSAAAVVLGEFWRQRRARRPGRLARGATGW